MDLNPLRNLSIPSVSDLLESPRLKRLVDTLSHNVVTSTIRKVLDEVRAEVQSVTGVKVPSVSDLADRIARRVGETDLCGLRPVINATGELLGSVLGPPPLPDAAIAALSALGRDYADEGCDPTDDKPLRRGAAIERRLQELTGAEAGLIASSLGATVMLTLAALGSGREVIVARSELIKTADGDRLPDLLAASGRTIREVGTANAVALDDYASAAGGGTGLILAIRAHGPFSSDLAQNVAVADLVRVGRERRVPVVCFLETASLVDLGTIGLAGVPVVRGVMNQGVDVALFSGTRLIGGPPCGIVVGRKTALETIARHPLAHTLAADKLTLAALAAVLEICRDSQQALQSIPLLQMLSTSEENLRNRAARLAPQVAAGKAIAVAEVVYCPSTRESVLPTCCIALRPADMSVQRLAARLRSGAPAVVGRVAGDRLLLNLRSVPPRQDMHLVAAVEALDT